MDEPQDVRILLRNQPPDQDTLFKILFAAIKLGKPASKRKIAETAHISSQLVDYHIHKLVDRGQLLFDGKLYRAQAAFTDRGLYKALTRSVIQQQLVEQLAARMDFSQKRVPDNEALEEAILALLRLFTIRLEEKRD